MVQALGFVSGILIIRMLPVEEYAWYVLANTMLGTMTVLANGGISHGVLAEGAKVWQNKNKLGIVLQTGLHLRKRFAIYSSLITIPILIYLLIDNNASILSTLLIVLSIIPAFYASLSDTLLQIVPKLHQNVKSLQINQLYVSFLRLITIFLIIFIYPLAFIMIFTGGFSRILGNINLKKIANENIDKNQNIDNEVKKNILKFVKRLMPEAIYYSLSGQLLIWLISIFGETKNIAELGALGRITALITVIILIIDYLFVPRFAKLKDNRKNILIEFFKIQGILFILSIIIITFLYLNSDFVLFILGNNYQNLNQELLLISINTCVGLHNTSTHKLLSSRGIILNPVFYITFMITIQFIFVFLFDLSTLNGVILYSTSTSLIVLFTRFIYLFKIA